MHTPAPLYIKAIFLHIISLACIRCATAQQPPQHNPIPGLRAKLDAAPAKDKILWQYRLAAAALRKGENDIAKTALDTALRQAGENYGTPNPDAAKSRLPTKRESDKPFVGEPYERALANYYRAILYWTDGDIENARALLRTAQLIDSDTAKKTYASDYILFDYLEGLANAKLGAPRAAAEALARARASAAAQKRPALPDYDPGANVLVFVEYSAGPEKSRSGDYGETLAYNIPTHVCTHAKLQIGAQAVELRPYDDIGFQALTHGGRLMDRIVAEKGRLGRKRLLTGLLLGEPILVFTSYSLAKNAKADTRCWDNLPRYLGFAALSLPPGTHAAELTYYDPIGRLYTNHVRRIAITVPEAAAKDTVIFCSMLRE